MQPVQIQNRLTEVDVLRGFAIFGMLVWNFRSWSFGNMGGSAGADAVICDLVTTLRFNETIHLVFAFLFGWGLTIQIIRADAKKPVVLATLIRRLVILFVIGIVHSVFWYHADILRDLAMLGFVIPFFIERSTRIILIASLVVIAAPVVVHVTLMKFGLPEEVYHHTDVTRELVTLSSYRDVVISRAKWLPGEYTHVEPFARTLDWIAMLLLGVYAARRGIFENIAGNINFIRKVFWLSFAVGLLATGWVTILECHQDLVTGHGSMYWLHALLSLGNRDWIVVPTIKLYSSHAFTIFYICLVVLLWHFNKWQGKLRPLAYIGKFPLSNYLLHSLIGTTIFYGYGFALYALNCTTREMMAIACFICQLTFSKWWSKQFQFGPVEWFWKSLSYAKFQPMTVNAYGRHGGITKRV